MAAHDRIRLTGPLKERPRKGPLPVLEPNIDAFATSSRFSVLAFANVPPSLNLRFDRTEIGGPNSLGRIAGICRVAQLFQREPVS